MPATGWLRATKMIARMLAVCDALLGSIPRGAPCERHQKSNWGATKSFMSAYMVQDECINSIVTWLFNPHREWDRVRVLETICLTSPNHQEELGKAMFAMNIRGVNARYGENQAQEFRDLDYTYQPHYTDSGYQVYDRLDEFLYQCGEGDIPEIDPLYRELKRLYDQLAHNFFRDLRERKEERENENRRELRLRIEKLETLIRR